MTFDLSTFGGNRDAYAFVQMLIHVASLWDDLVDRDTPPTADEINRGMMIALVYLPSNRFYREHFDQLSPLMAMGGLNFIVAHTYEREAESHGLELAHGLRYAVTSVVGYVVAECIGPEAAMQVLPGLYKALCSERFAPYFHEHARGQNDAE